jgi:hypothetical protein
MPGYVPMGVILSQHQGRKLLSGGAIALKKSQCGGSGDTMIHLTSQQHNRLMKGNGMRLRFSAVQLSHNRKHGKGLTSWVKAGAKKGVDLAADYAKGAAGSAVKGALSTVPLVGNLAGRLAEKGIHKGLDAVAGVVKRKIGSGMKKKKGKGLFGSVLGGVGDFTDALGNRIIGNGCGAPAGYGGGLFPPGYGGGLLPKPIKGVNSNSAGI